MIGLCHAASACKENYRNFAPIDPLHQPYYYGHHPVPISPVSARRIPVPTIACSRDPGCSRFDDYRVFRRSRAKQFLIVCRFYQGGARRQNRTVPAYGLPPITVRRFALLTASLVPPRSSNCDEIAIPAVSMPKGQTMIVKKTNQPTHRVYAVRRARQDSNLQPDRYERQNIDQPR
jgi:hypothetical protein